jgi:hypothetical protein
VIPVIIRAMGIVTKGLNKYLETIVGKHSIHSLQKQPCQEHHIRRKVLQSETWSLSGGVCRWLKRRGIRGKTRDKRINNNNFLLLIITIITTIKIQKSVCFIPDSS